MDRCLDPGHRGQSVGQEGLLERGEGVLETGPVGLGLTVGGFGRPAGAQQFLFVGAAVARVEDGGADQQGPTGGAVFDDGGDQDRHPSAAGLFHLQRDASYLAAHLQERREVRLVVQLAAHGEQVGEPHAAHHVVLRQAEPLEQPRVDLGDGAVHQGGQISARGALVQLLDAVLQQRRERRVGGLLVSAAPLGIGLLVGSAHHRRPSRNFVIAWLVASGADRCGQCPVASRVTRAEPGIAWWTKAPTSRGAMAS